MARQKRCPRRSQRGRGLLSSLAKRAGKFAVKEGKKWVKNQVQNLPAKAVGKLPDKMGVLKDVAEMAVEAGISIALGSNPLIGATFGSVMLGIKAGQEAKAERKKRTAYRKKHRAIGGRFWNMGEGRGSMYGRM